MEKRYLIGFWGRADPLVICHNSEEHEAKPCVIPAGISLHRSRTGILRQLSQYTLLPEVRPLFRFDGLHKRDGRDPNHRQREWNWRRSCGLVPRRYRISALAVGVVAESRARILPTRGSLDAGVLAGG